MIRLCQLFLVYVNVCVCVIVRVLESLLVCMVTTLVIFMSSMTLGECRDLVSTITNTTSQVRQTQVFVR